MHARVYACAAAMMLFFAVARARAFRYNQLMTTRYALYARVSTLNDSQTTSFETQEEDLSARIKVLYPDYELFKVYGDLGISGTKEDRPEFKRMIQDAKAGKFEVIITKSISRFARNTRLLLNALNELETAGVGVIFLEENLDTRQAGQKFILTVLGGSVKEAKVAVAFLK